MTWLIEAACWIVVLAVLVPTIFLFVECLAAFAPAPRERVDDDGPRPTVVVLMPAHQEEAGIGRAIASVQADLADPDQLLVVADQCSDRTAEVAREAGARVVERHSADGRGKEHALAYGVESLRQAPPDMVVVVDADCRIDPGSIEALIRTAYRTRRPAQANYLIQTAPDDDLRSLVNTFAFMVKNLVRPRGLHRLGLPCLLTGTGTAFPWEVISKAPLITGTLAEDYQLGVEVSLMGHPPIFCPRAKVSTRLPTRSASARAQRTRWEHGHMQALYTQVPRLLWAAVRLRRPSLCVPALELLVPPLSLLVLVWVAATALTAAAARWEAFMALAAAGLLLAAAIGGSWARFGRSTLPAAVLAAVPMYVVWKIPIYLSFVFRRQKAWLRTERD